MTDRIAALRAMVAEATGPSKAVDENGERIWPWILERERASAQKALREQAPTLAADLAAALEANARLRAALEAIVHYEQGYAPELRAIASAALGDAP